MDINFVKDNFLFVVGGLVSVFVIAQSLFFLIVAYKRGKDLDISKDVMNKIVKQSVIFSIVPSLAILLTVVTLSKALGLALPWIRLSVIGAITYEVPAAEAAAKVFGSGIGSAINDPVAFAAVAWVMTIGSLIPLVVIPLFLKKYQNSLNSYVKKDNKWGKILMAAIFIGMISAFLGAGIAGSEADGVVYGSVISILTLLTSAITMVICAYFIKVKKVKWLENFAMPVSMIVAMGMSIVYYNMLPEVIASWRIPGLF